MIPEFKDAVSVDWEHNDFTNKTELTVRFLASSRVVVDDGENVPYDDICQQTIERLRTEVAESASGICHATSNPPVPKHWTGCSNCGSVWDFFYNNCGYMGPPNFCPRCGAKVRKQ